MTLVLVHVIEGYSIPATKFSCGSRPTGVEASNPWQLYTLIAVEVVAPPRFSASCHEPTFVGGAPTPKADSNLGMVTFYISG